MTDLIDTHTHINYSPLMENVESVIERAVKNSVVKLICVGTDMETSRIAIRLAEKFEHVYASAGIHPHDSVKLNGNWADTLRELLSHEKIVALGEIGLDYYRDYAPVEVQKSVFSKQVKLAKKLNLPMIIHNRRADGDIADILGEENYHQGVLHCFSGHLEFAQSMIDRGCMLSFTGNVTYRSKKTIRVLRNIPADKFMLETDSPFILPRPLKDKTNEPANLPLIAAAIAEIRETAVEEINRITTENALNFFFRRAK